MSTSKIGILLTNIGSPSEPTTTATRIYLRKFLSDPRVVELPKLIWWFILNFIILLIRPKKSAKLYQQIWTREGSPLLVISKKLAAQLKNTLQLPVELGMHYGDPSIEMGINALCAQDVTKILIFPLFPQYSSTTTAVSFDQVAAALKKMRNIPEIRFIHDYATDEHYIEAICKTVAPQNLNYLLFSFHGLPQRNITLGDPYEKQCYATVDHIAAKLGLTKDQYGVSFQSRLSRKWLTPFTDEVLTSLPQKGIKHLSVICPGFPIDCLETLEEISIRGQKQFLKAGGLSFQYIAALNDQDFHIHFLKVFIEKKIREW